MGQTSSRIDKPYPAVPGSTGNGLYYPRHDPSVPLPEGVTHEELDIQLDKLDKFGDFLESKWHIFGNKMQVGVDTILGFVPVVGDVVLGVVSLYVVQKSRRLHIARWRRSVIKMNAVIDFGIGTIPLIGGLFNAWFACNRRNINHILRHYGRRPGVQASLFVSDNSRDIPETPMPDSTSRAAASAPTFFPPPVLDPGYAGGMPGYNVTIEPNTNQIPYPTAPAMHI